METTPRPAVAAPPVATGEEHSVELVEPGLRARAARSTSWRRLAASYLLTLFVLITLNFFLPRALPGDPISALVDTESPNFVQDEDIRAELTEYYGLDRPLIEQYGDYLLNLARGDLGTSIRYNVPVNELVGERLPWSLLLVTTAVVMATLLGVVAGVHSGWRRGRPVDKGLLGIFLSVTNLPSFFAASIALFAFAVQLGWVPLSGASTPFATDVGLLERVGDVAHHLVLPASVMALQLATLQYLLMRAAMVSELGADHLVLGRAKGLTERRLKYRYAARNAVLPVVNLTAVHMKYAVSGFVIFVETVFAYPGMGRLMFDALGFRDYPVLQGSFLVLALLVLGANLVADLATRRLDPRTAT